jgi:hypothetical protein
MPARPDRLSWKGPHRRPDRPHVREQSGPHLQHSAGTGVRRRDRSDAGLVLPLRRIVNVRLIERVGYVVRGHVPTDVSCMGQAYGGMWQSATREAARRRDTTWVRAHRGH